jgi:hypothetical protein
MTWLVAALVLAALTWDQVMRAWRRGVRRELAARGWHVDGDAVRVGGHVEELATLYTRLARGEREAVLRAWEVEVLQRARDSRPVWSEDAARVFPRVDARLAVSYVLESPAGTTAVTAEGLRISPEALHARALANLRGRVSRPDLSAPVVLDEAAAILLVPEWLTEDQEVFAFAADTRTLRLAPRIEELDTTPSRALERLAEGPVRVTRAGPGRV